MAKGRYIDYKKAQSELFKRTEGYARNVGAIYRQTLADIINLVKGTKLEQGKPFNFADYGYGDEVTPMLRKMYSRVYQTIRGGVEAEWIKADENNDGLVKAVFGEEAIENHFFAKYFQHNMDAMKAFATRKTSGLDLSQRVWRYTGAYKEELENTLDLALGEGTAANRLATKIQKYLDDPDRWYRRFRVRIGEDEDGNPKYGRIWKRRVYDNETQGYKWIDDNPKTYHPGTGVYRSSYRNAQRLARTETNIAYRTAEFDRWQTMPFVIGIEIKLSNNHGPEMADICDELAGIYPKGFKWTGWHPNCRCYQQPALAKDEERDQMLDRILDGGNPDTVHCEDAPTDLPPQFKGWLDANKERMERAAEKGTLPYFIKDNEDVINGKKAPTPIEIAKKRHDERTEEEAQAIRKKWNDRVATRKYGHTMLDYMSGIADVDVSALVKALSSGDNAAILAEAKALKAIGKQILGLDKLENPMQVAKDFSMADAVAVNNAVAKTMQKVYSNDLASYKSKLEYELDWAKAHPKYATTKVAIAAYKKEIARVDVLIRRERMATDIKGVEVFAQTTDLDKVKALYTQLKAAYENRDLATTEKLLNEAKDAIEEYKAELLRQGMKSTTDLEKYCDKHRTFKSGITNETKFNEYQDRMIAETGPAWRAGSQEAREAVSGYTNGTYDAINRSYYQHHKPDSRGTAMDSILDNITTSKDMVLRRGCDLSEMKSIFGEDFYNLMMKGDMDALNAVAGCRGVNEGFISTSFSMQGGFWRSVDLRIYAPKGTQGIYAKPVSGYGDGNKASWDGLNANKKFDKGRENEFIVHRGYEYRFIKAEAGGKNGSRVTIYIELLGRDKRLVP